MDSSTLLVPRRPLRPDPEQTAQLWARFVVRREPAVRDLLFAAYQEFARMLAAKMFGRRLYTEMEFDDYLQYATVGLIEAIDRFDPARGFKFETYAVSRINGAILSGIECSSEVQQQLVARKRIVGERVASLSAQAPRDAGEGVFGRLAEIAIGLAVGFALEDSGMHQAAEPEYADNSYVGVEMKQLKERINQVLAELPPDQRKVIQMHYLNHSSFAEIAAGMALTPGRIAQIHKQALAAMKARLHHSGTMDLRF